MPMQGAGQLCISERETAVMLLDCEKMAKIWQRPEAERGHQKIYFHDRVQSTPGMWRRLSGVWNARDPEYAPGGSKGLHYTPFPPQPWRPFTDRKSVATGQRV